jgi:hypothetical protein
MNENGPMPTDASEHCLTTELLLLPDGRVLVHNLTPAFADLLRELAPEDGRLAARAPRPAARVFHLTPDAAANSHSLSPVISSTPPPAP